MDPSLLDNVVIPDGFFKYICHVGCAINLQSMINSGLIPRGQNLSKERQTVFFLPVDPMDKEHKDPDTIDLGNTASCTIHAYSMGETSKHGVLGRHQTCSKERIEVLLDTIERHHSSRNTPSLLNDQVRGDPCTNLLEVRAEPHTLQKKKRNLME